MKADEISRAIIEHEDRWLFKPLRGRTVIRIEWKSDHLELVLDDNYFHVFVGYDAELSARSLAKDSPDRHRIDHWNRAEVEEFLGSKIVSAVFFKSGAVRLGLKNGWILFVEANPQGFSAEVQFGDRAVWNTAGITDHSIFEIQPLDAWTGQPVTPTHWPGRPDHLKDNPGSDDIND
ncbi:hypothetical protein B7C42_07177 [Nocardia cerradoensis]|uniref:Uncharacterized protein n=1 Tax=Nocardia cerradoensis TaxID=85688 RepID=A0A231GVU2_9NOCA|nr:DUF6188 family protein [Nocardia cerradoensis]OXR40753.1 hypothetical protein B7C42_07177 [Nocardia cerradoensis]